MMVRSRSIRLLLGTLGTGLVVGIAIEVLTSWLSALPDVVAEAMRTAFQVSPDLFGIIALMAVILALGQVPVVVVLWRQLILAKSEKLLDSLTEIPGRGACASIFEEMREKADRQKKPVAIAFLDLEDFKAWNAPEYGGHDNGSKLLKSFATALRGRLRREEEVVRYGGDEFVVMMLGDKVGVRAGLNSIHDDFSRESAFERLDGEQTGLSFHAGIAQVRKNESFADVVKRAETRCNFVKEGAVENRFLTEDPPKLVASVKAEARNGSAS